jgi:hypothetical protein
MWHCVGLVRTRVLEECVASIFRGKICEVFSADAVLSSPILSTLKMEATKSSEMSVLTRSTRRHIPEDGILHSHRRENLKYYTAFYSKSYGLDDRLCDLVVRVPEVSGSIPSPTTGSEK